MPRDPQFDPRDLRDAFGCFASGITIVTLPGADGRPTGMTVSSFASLSLDPPLCLFSVGRHQASAAFFDADRPFTVNVLGAAHEDAAWQFARPAEDKFAGIAHSPGENGLPVLDRALCHFECRLWETYDGGDLLIVVGRIERFAVDEGDPLVFWRGRMAGLAA